jgi:hypothetical protein
MRYSMERLLDALQHKVCCFRSHLTWLFLQSSNQLPTATGSTGFRTIPIPKSLSTSATKWTSSNTFRNSLTLRCFFSYRFSSHPSYLLGDWYWWITHWLRVTSINVIADELIQTMGWNDVRPSVIRVPHAMYDTIYPFCYADAWWLLMGLAGAAVNIIEASSSSALNNNGMRYCNGSEQALNPDIVGMGVRLSTYILLFSVFASLFTGSFHSGPSGTKELGIVTLISTSRLQDPEESIPCHADRAQIYCRWQSISSKPTSKT